MTKYVALLRGINVGGHKPVKMQELRATFEALGFRNVKTLLASGNVLFEAASVDPDRLGKRIENALKVSVGHDISVQLRTIDEIKKLADADPFKNIKVAAQTRLYVTFLAEKPKSGIKAPYAPNKGFKIVRVSARDVCSVVTLSPQHQTTDLMVMLEKEFGRKLTTRNWNTVARILKG